MGTIAPFKGTRIQESGNFLLVESGILGFGIQNTAQGIRNPAPGIPNPRESWIPLHGRSTRGGRRAWGELYKLRCGTDCP